MKITVLYNHVENLPFGKPEEVLADEDTVVTAQAVAQALQTLGHQVDLFEVDENSVKRLSGITTDFFFNLAEGIDSLPNTEYQVIELLEERNLPFSGSGSTTLQLTTDKQKTKDLLQANGLATPNFQVLLPGDTLRSELRFPLVVKPVAMDGSVGINGHSVLDNPEDVYDQVDFLTSTYQEPALVEEYIDGRELNATVLGEGDHSQVLPISEIVFGPSFSGKYKMVDFAAKWEENSVAYQETQGICPASLDDQVLNRITNISLTATALTGCRNYTRVDFRLATDNTPYILEVNANPGIAPDSGVIRSAKAAGYTFASFLGKLVELAQKNTLAYPIG